VDLVDNLMRLAGELVLIRNQHLLSVDKKDPKTGKLIRKAYIRDWVKDVNDKNVKIKIYFYKDVVPQEFFNNIWKSLRMETYIPVSNMHLFDENRKIKKFDTQYEIIDYYYNVRLDFYDKRKVFQIKQLKFEIEVIKNRMLFIKSVIEDKIKINKRSREQVETDIVNMKLMMVNDSFNYLLNMSIVSLTKEKLMELKDEFEKSKEKLKTLELTKIEDIWLSELDELKKKLK
jgi:DNA topoisomerase-2